MPPGTKVVAIAALTIGATSAQTAEQALARQAEGFVATGRLEEAIGIYRDLVRTSPDNPTLLLNLTIAEYKGKRYTEAAVHAEAALKRQPDLLPARLFLGACLLELGDFASAVEPLAVVARNSPSDRNARLMLGEALLGAGRSGEAVAHLSAAAELLPASSRVWYGLGRAYAALGRSEAASSAWDRLAALPPSAESHLHAAQTHDAAQRWLEAATEWRAALELAPQSYPARMGLGWSLFRGRDYDGAMAALKPSLAGGPADVQFLYGASLLNLQQPLPAIPYLRAAIAKDGQLLPARAALGQGLLQIGQVEEAIPLLREARASDIDGNIHFQLFRAYQLTHREGEARDALAAYQRLRGSISGDGR